jgi:hypothetical protein
MTAITLNAKQRRRAKELLQRLSNNDVTEPKDIVEQWEQEPDYDELNTDKPILDMDLQREQKYIPVSDIIGTGAGPADRLEQARLKAVLELLIDGEFKQECKRPPKIEGICGDYYVAVDGVHRTLAFKAIGLEEIFAEVIEIPVN